MIEENGHKWEGPGEHRCVRCFMPYRQYLEFKAAYDAAIKEGEPDHAAEVLSMLVCGGGTPRKSGPIEENGHKWESDDLSEYNRCLNCGLKYRQYLEFKKSAERDIAVIRERATCKGRNSKPLTFPGDPDPGDTVVQVDFFDPETMRWSMLLNLRFNDPALAKRIKETVDRMMAEAGIKGQGET